MARISLETRLIKYIIFNCIDIDTHLVEHLKLQPYSTYPYQLFRRNPSFTSITQLQHYYKVVVLCNFTYCDLFPLTFIDMLLNIVQFMHSYFTPKMHCLALYK